MCVMGEEANSRKHDGINVKRKKRLLVKERSGDKVKVKFWETENNAWR